MDIPPVLNETLEEILSNFAELGTTLSISDSCDEVPVLSKAPVEPICDFEVG